MAETKFIKYILAFTKHVVTAYDGWHTVQAPQHTYGITGKGTLELRVRQYAHAGLGNEVMVIQRPDEQERKKRLEPRVKALKSGDRL